MYTVHVYMHSVAIIYQAENNLIHNVELNSPLMYALHVLPGAFFEVKSWFLGSSEKTHYFSF